MEVSVLGCGRWGGFIAWYLNRIGHKTLLWGRSTSAKMERLMRERKNEYLTFDKAIELTVSLEKALKNDVVMISIGAQQLRSLCKQIAEYDVAGKTFVFCMKGIEKDTGCRLSEVAKQELPDGVRVAIWVGPGHVQDIAGGVPNCMVIDSEFEDTKHMLVDSLSSDLIRFYYGTDMIGNEIGAASKNVVGLAAGMLDGIGYGSLKGALMTRATREISRLIEAMGGNARTAYGLSHLGDYEATLFSPHSRNRMFGESLIKEEPMDGLAEGVQTALAMSELGKRYNVELPICSAVNDIVNCGKDPRSCLTKLFDRSIKMEF